MGTINYTVPVAGSTLNSVADPEISTALQTLLTWANGNVDAVNLSALLAQSAAVNQSGQTVKGAVNISASESRTNTAYGTMPTPDQVTGITLATNGLIQVWYQATWQQSVASAAQAAIFLNGNQLTAAPRDGGGAPVSQLTNIGNLTGTNIPLTSFYGGLNGNTSGSSAYTGDVTTGQIVGGVGSSITTGGSCCIFASAGTYTVSVQFKASSGSVTVANRKLWVQALSFA